VAEHAVVHVAVEDISILASKVIEDARLASFTEKSTRYVPFDTTRYHVPAAFMGRPAEAVFQAGVEAVMSAYRDLMEPLVRHLAAAIPPRPGQTERGHQSACRAQACDILRYLLPAATHTNLGMTANARTLEALLSKMFSHPLEEVRQAGEAIREEALRIVPTLIKYAARSEYRSGIETQLRKAAAGMLAAETGREGMEDRFPVAAILEDDGSFCSMPTCPVAEVTISRFGPWKKRTIPSKS
jgi:thymidylate synthase ThyX